jgi:ArsR family transcriptional regulator
MKATAKLFKAISNETRLAIMVLLSQKELCVCQIEKILNLSQAKVSRHLTVLKHTGLVSDRREGLWIYYSIVKPRNKIESKIYEIFTEFKINLKELRVDAAKLRNCGDIKGRR